MVRIRGENVCEVLGTHPRLTGRGQSRVKAMSLMWIMTVYIPHVLNCTHEGMELGFVRRVRLLQLWEASSAAVIHIPAQILPLAAMHSLRCKSCQLSW